VKPVAANVPARRDVAVDCVGRRRRRQVVKERGVEHRNVRQIWYRRARYPDTEHRRWIVQRRKR
jgi:hypothetical protein